MMNTLLTLGLSRTREYEADLMAADLTGDPRGLASALQRIEQSRKPWWERFFFPMRREVKTSWLKTHPPTEERIRSLLEKEQKEETEKKNMIFKEVLMQTFISKVRSPDLFLTLTISFTGLCAVFMLSGEAVGQGETTHPTADPFYVMEDSGQEKEGDIQSYSPVKVTQSPMIEELHRARQDGDLATFQKLEAQLEKPQPIGVCLNI